MTTVAVYLKPTWIRGVHDQNGTYCRGIICFVSPAASPALRRYSERLSRWTPDPPDSPCSSGRIGSFGQATGRGRGPAEAVPVLFLPTWDCGHSDQGIDRCVRSIRRAFVCSSTPRPSYRRSRRPTLQSDAGVAPAGYLGSGSRPGFSPLLVACRFACIEAAAQRALRAGEASTLSTVRALNATPRRTKAARPRNTI